MTKTIVNIPMIGDVRSQQPHLGCTVSFRGVSLIEPLGLFKGHRNRIDRSCGRDPFKLRQGPVDNKKVKQKTTGFRSTHLSGRLTTVILHRPHLSSYWVQEVYSYWNALWKDDCWYVSLKR